MRYWRASSKFALLAIVVTVSMFLSYNVNLGLCIGLSKAYAQDDIDDLLDADDSDLLGEAPEDTSPAEEMPEEVEPEPEPEPKPKPEPEPEPEKKAEPADDQDDDFDEDEDEDFDEDEDSDKADKAKEEDLEDEDDDFDEDEDEEIAEPVAEEKPVEDSIIKEQEDIEIGPRVDGETKISVLVLPGSRSHLRRAVEISDNVETWFRGNDKFTYVPANYSLGDRSALSEKKRVRKADVFFEDGKRAYENVSLPEAIENLKKAVDLYRPFMEYFENRDAVIDSLLFLGASQVLAGSEDEGGKTFAHALWLDSELELDQTFFPVGVQEVFEKAKTARSMQATSALSVETSRKGAPVYLDGDFRGLTPLNLSNLPVGEHYLKVKAPGYQEYRSKLSLYEGMTKKVNVPMKQVTRYYPYKAEVNDIGKKYEHRYMWTPVQGLGKVLSRQHLLVAKVFEERGVVTIDGYYYNMETEEYKHLNERIDTVSSNLENNTYSYMNRLFSDDVEYMTAFVAPEELKEADEEEEETPLYAQWWLWTVVGVVVAGAVAGIVVWQTMDSGSDDKETGPQFEHPNAVLITF